MSEQSSGNTNKKWIIILTVLLVAAIAVIIVLAVSLKSKSGVTPADTDTTAQSESAETSATADPGNAVYNPPADTEGMIIGEDLPTEDCFAIETPYCPIYLPNEYKDLITCEITDSEVLLYGTIGGEKYPLYKITFGSDSGYSMGNIVSEDGSMIRVAVEDNSDPGLYETLTGDDLDLYSAMIETQNVVHNQLTKLENYAAG